MKNGQDRYTIRKARTQSKKIEFTVWDKIDQRYYYIGVLRHTEAKQLNNELKKALNDGRFMEFLKEWRSQRDIAKAKMKEHRSK